MSAELAPMQVDLGFIQQPKAYTLLNSSMQEIRFQWNAEAIIIPPRNEIAERSKYKSAVDSEGTIIKGSVIIRDIPNYRNRRKQNDMGSESVVETWYAAEALLHGLQIDITSSTMEAKEFQRGISVLPEVPKPEQVATADAAGRARAEKWEEVIAIQVIAAEESKWDNERRAGLKQSAPSEGYIRSKMLADMLGDRRKKALYKEYGYREKADVDAAPTAVQQPVAITDEDQMKRLIPLLKDELKKEIEAEYFSKTRKGNGSGKVTKRKRTIPVSKQIYANKVKNPVKAKSERITAPVD